MANQFEWKTPDRVFPVEVDPYSTWLLDTAENSLVLESLPRAQNDPWFLVFLGNSGETANAGSITEFGDNGVIWKPKGSDFAFMLKRQAIGEFRSSLSSPGLVEEFRNFGMSETSAMYVSGDATEDESHVELYAQIAPLDDAMVPKKYLPDTTENEQTNPGIDTEKSVIIGIIDDGINIAHERFIDPAGEPRIDYTWLQDGRADSPSPVLFGREFTAAHIKAARQKNDTEEGTLRDLGLVDPAKAEPTTLSKSFSHGTFVLDSLAGYPSDPTKYSDRNPCLPDENDGTDPKDRRIIAVQLHRRVTQESSGALYTLFAMLGLQYIVDRARKLAKEIRGQNEPKRKIPLVVNFSYGLAGGPHNGDHLFERFVDQLVARLDADEELGPLIVPMPTGNRHLLKGHAHKVADKSGNICLDMQWITQPQDKSPNYLEIWLPKSSNPVSLKLKPPFGSDEYILEHTFDTGDTTSLQGKELRDANENVVARVTLDTLDAKNSDETKREIGGPAQYAKARILVALAPTYPVEDEAAHIPPGLWSVSVKTKVSKGQYIEAWIQRDDSPPLFQRPGRQSYLENGSWSNEWQRTDELSEHLLPLKEIAALSRYGAINGLATGHSMLRVSGVRHYENYLPAIYSGASHDGMRAVQVAAPCDRSRVFKGLVGAGGRSGSTQIMNGTSVAAPIIGRSIADYLSKNPHPDAQTAINAFLSQKTADETSAVPVSTGGKSPIDSELGKHPELRRKRGGKPIRFGAVRTAAGGNGLNGTPSQGNDRNGDAAQACKPDGITPELGNSPSLRR